MREILQQLADQYDSFYLYSESEIIAHAEQLQNTFPAAQFLYSVKCNPCPEILKAVTNRGFGLDAASRGEVAMGAALGVSPALLHYSAPGKTRADLEASWQAATIVADSIHELELLQAVAAEHETSLNIGIRLHPARAFDGGPAAPSKFGIEERQAVEILENWPFDRLKVTGIHVHLKSQTLDAEGLAGYYGIVLELAKRVQAMVGTPLDFVNVGSGIGIPYAETDNAMDLPVLGELTKKLVQQAAEELSGTRFLIETGRFISGKSGVYVTHVADKKTCGGKTYVILQNTLNGFIRPSLAQLVERSGAAAPCEPLYTGPDSFPLYPLQPREDTEIVTLVGNLCTAADVVAEDIPLPHLEIGDVIVITNAGSYAAVLSPMQFSSQVPPRQLFWHQNGNVTVF